MNSATKSFAAVDLGASSGRVMLGRVGPGSLELAEVHRFANVPVRVAGRLHWDVLGLYRGVLDGLHSAGEAAGRHLDSVGIDSWAVDYGSLDADGHLLGNPVHYRDQRTEGVAEKFWATMPARELYAATGIQYAPFNTLYQLLAAKGTPQYESAASLMLIPDLIAYWLTGNQGTEITNASTTQLIDPSTRTWAHAVAEAAGIDVDRFPPLGEPGSSRGVLLPDVLDEIGLAEGPPVRLTTVASHDTASAVAATPACEGEHFAFISTGTWSLAGLELDAPVMSEASRAANFTNELGIDGTVRYLRNIMGLWLLQECMREWRTGDIDAVIAAATHVPPLRSVVDAADSRFLAPGRMSERIAEYCRETGQPEPRNQAETTRCVLDSLALAHKLAIEDAQQLTGRSVDVVHIVGGGARNVLLCQLTADATGLPVVAGPTEAAALGNVLVQARSLGGGGDRWADRRLVAQTQPLARFRPAPAGTQAWNAAVRRLLSPLISS